jgi:hypothetical protein
MVSSLMIAGSFECGQNHPFAEDLYCQSKHPEAGFFRNTRTLAEGRVPGCARPALARLGEGGQNWADVWQTAKRRQMKRVFGCAMCGTVLSAMAPGELGTETGAAWSSAAFALQNRYSDSE